MFKLVAKPSDDSCAAFRCKERINLTEAGEGTGVWLCPRHLEMWRDADSPDLRMPVASPSTGAALVPADVPPRVQAETTEATETLALIESLPTGTPEDLEYLSNIGIEAKARSKVLEEERTSITAPLNQALKRVNALFKPAIKVYDDMARGVNRRLLAVQAEAERAKKEALTLIEAGDDTDEILTVVQDAPEVTLPRGVGNDLPDYRILDVSAIPREYFMLDHQKLMADARRFLREGNPNAVPGVEFVYKKSGT